MANEEKKQVSQYTDEDIKKLPPREQVRLRPGMWIGKLGDGTLAEDGIYTLIKEVVDNSVDEFTMGYGSQIDITIELAWDGDYTYDSLNEAFRKWKEEQPIQEPKTRRDESDAPSTSSHLSTSGIIADILAWPLEQKTPLENTMFISTLKQKIATLL